MTAKEEESVRKIIHMFVAVIMSSNHLIDRAEIKDEGDLKLKEELYRAYNKIYKEFVVPDGKDKAQ